MTTSEVESRNITISMRKSMENLVISSQDAIGQSISQALTFSGVITQHTNIIHENRSVSRSPSPSLRSADCGPDSLENDKVTERWLLQSEGCAQAAHGSDSASVSSGEVVTVVNAPPNKTDNPKASSQNPGPRSIDSAGAGTRTKKKSWYNALYPTYKSKCDDFKRLFKDLPDDERLIVDYSCALQKDILAHGRLYASQNYLCFYASFFSWETSLTLRWKDVTAITKEKTALVIPNAILICTEGEKNFLTSFSGRDKAYLMLFRIWQNALMDQPMSSQEIWQWVHNCYGEELGFNSDEEGYMREGPDDVPALPSEVLEDQVDSSSVDASGGADTKEDSKSNRSASHGRDSSPPLASKRNSKQMKRFSEMSSVLGFWRVVEGCEIAIPAAPVTNGDADEREEDGGDTLPTDMSDTSESEPDKPNNGGQMEKCSEPHDGKLLLKQQFPFNIDNLFTMIFTNSKFQLELLAARGTTDYVQAPWQVQNGRKCRQISYRLSLSTGPIGPKEVHVTETQVMNKCSKPGVLYSIEVTSDNSGIPYADYISVIAHYCLTRVAESVTELSIYGSIKYKRSMWPMVKAFMEKNAMGGMEEFSRLLEARLTAEADGAAPQARKARRHRRLTSSSQEPAGVCGGCAGGAAAAGPLLAPRASLRAAAPRTPHERARARPWLGAALLLLLALNALLYWKLYHAEQHHTFDLEDLQNRMSSVSDAQMSDWSKLLEAHSLRQRGQLRAWRRALDRTVQHLAQTEQALTKLLETIKPSLEGAQNDANERNEL